ncbi:MAG: hypothetical protein DWH79_09105 [Planctomycetota bacterium]|nr:MAG: hypothetical protein DWH79_09105 [Planctomycetota bacterium]
MTSIDRADPGILSHLLAEHRELWNQLSAVRCALAAPAPADCTEVKGIVASIQILREHLASHFSQEECGGFMEESVARMPRLNHAVSDVLREHPLLLADLDAIVSRFGSAAGQTPCADAWREIGASFEAFAARIQAHERAENDVVQQGYNEDLGLLG